MIRNISNCTRVVYIYGLFKFPYSLLWVNIHTGVICYMGYKPLADLDQVVLGIFATQHNGGLQRSTFGRSQWSGECLWPQDGLRSSLWQALVGARPFSQGYPLVICCIAI